MADSDYRRAFDDATHRLDQFRHKLHERQSAIHELETIKVTHTSPDGRVTVEVDSDGRLTNLRLSSDAAALSPSQISAAVMQTYQLAAREAAARAAELLAPVFGDDSPVVDRFHRRVDAPSAANEQGQRAARAAATPDYEDDEFDSTSFYRG